MAIRTYQYRIYPTISQIEKFDRDVEFLRLLYNASLQDLFARNPTTLVVGGIAHSLTFLLDKQKSLVYISIYDKNSFY